MYAATSSSRRCRPPRLSAATIRLRVSVAPAAGVGAMARMARASVLARLLVWSERGEEAGIELAEDGADLLQGFGPSPGRVLVGAGQHRDRLGQLGVVGQRSVDVAVGAQNVGQQHGVGVVGLAACGRVAFTVAGDRHRVDRVDRPAGSYQGGDQQPARGFDRDRHGRLLAVAARGQQFGEFAEPVDGLGNPFLGQQCAPAVDDGDVVVPFGPVDTAEHAHRCPPRVGRWSWSKPAARARGDLIARLWAFPPMSRSRSQRPASPSLRLRARRLARVKVSILMTGGRTMSRTLSVKVPRTSSTHRTIKPALGATHRLAGLPRGLSGSIGYQAYRRLRWPLAALLDGCGRRFPSGRWHRVEGGQWDRRLLPVRGVGDIGGAGHGEAGV
jgi:hypothetical protein